MALIQTSDLSRLAEGQRREQGGEDTRVERRKTRRTFMEGRITTTTTTARRTLGNRGR